MPEVTKIIQRIQDGDLRANDDLLPVVYDELRRIAASRMKQERTGHTLQATALVHEAYLRLIGSDSMSQWSGRAHFFSAAAEAMRRILIESARQKNALKRRRKAPVDRDPDIPIQEVELPGGIDLLDLDRALNELGQEDPVKAELVKLRYFAGFTLNEAAEIAGISRASAQRYWDYSKAWLHRRLAAN